MPDPGTVGAAIAGSTVGIAVCIMSTAVPFHVFKGSACKVEDCYTSFRANERFEENFTETIRVRNDGMNSGNAGDTPLFSRVASLQSNRTFELDWSATTVAQQDRGAPAKLRAARGAPQPVPSAPPFPVFDEPAPVPSAPILRQPRAKPHLV